MTNILESQQNRSHSDDATSELQRGLHSDDAAVEQLSCFQLDGKPIFCRRFGGGHINTTYLVMDETARVYILQKINQHVFRDPLGVMSNIVAVTAHLAAKAESPRHVLELVPSRGGGNWIVDKDGEYWRAYSFISDSICYQTSENLTVFRESAAAFGSFQRSLADFPAVMLKETIPGFHNTPERYETFRKAVRADEYDRVKYVEKDIDFAMERAEKADVLINRHLKGALPLRVTHNDTKLNNVLFDRRTKKNLCVIDLDTVMPGFSVTDFGDSIRFGASTAAEDERDISKVSFSLRLFEAYAEGFLSTCGAYLTGDETASLCDGAYTITLENGVRFLTDYLTGDFYYRTAYDGHNIDRCRTQFKLVEDMEKARGEMDAIIDRVMSSM